MELIPKFANIVVLGSFNPGILTIDFLQNSCNIPLKSDSKASQNPIESFVSSGNNTFIASLERFEVSEIDFKDFAGIKINEYTKAYLDTLKYTPLKACGMNLSADMRSVNLKLLQQYFIEDHSSLAELLKAEELTIRNDMQYSKGSKEIVQYSVKFSVKSKETNGNLRIKANSDKSYNLQYNYEIRNKSDFNLILIDYQERVKEFERLSQGIG